MTDTRDHGPVLIDLDPRSEMQSPADAPAVAEPEAAPTGQAMQTVATLAGRPRSALAAWFWRLLGAVVIFFAGVALWDWTASLIARNEVLGAVALTLLVLFVLVCLAIILREAAALARLSRVERLHDEAARVIASGDTEGARTLARHLASFYAGRDDTKWGRQRLEEGIEQSFDPDVLITLAEDSLLAPLDAMALREVEAAARQVATVTALVPLAFADVAAALTSNLRMIRRIAEVYGGRSGTLGAWRLTRAVLTHLVATGAVAVGDDLIGSVGGGHILAKLSRRFGEGMINGALTARVGIAAMEVCRPLPFGAGRRPRVTAVIGRALTGLFDRT